MNAGKVEELDSIKKKFNPTIIETSFENATLQMVNKCHELGMKHNDMCWWK